MFSTSSLASFFPQSSSRSFWTCRARPILEPNAASALASDSSAPPTCAPRFMAPTYSAAPLADAIARYGSTPRSMRSLASRSLNRPSHRAKLVSSSICTARNVLPGSMPRSSSRNIAILARAYIASPALMAWAGPHFHHTESRPARCGLPDWTSSWISRNPCKSSSAAAAGRQVATSPPTASQAVRQATPYLRPFAVPG